VEAAIGDVGDASNDSGPEGAVDAAAPPSCQDPSSCNDCADLTFASRHPDTVMVPGPTVGFESHAHFEIVARA
jgi:hypothetical protein